ncbi:MAG: hypothetical protein RMM53_07885, partial [Bacteroidia bacterium]|nr:hypothetical protein [Bacteroidia bacterium]MDW8334120.1 hypothetical protein [Bacteroidia bacterium]
SANDVRVTGLADVSFWGAFHVLQTGNPTNPWRHRLALGAGVEIPTGHYYLKDETGARLPPLVQPGSGSWDGMFNLVYFMSYRRWGATVSALYKRNGRNYYLESMGDVAVGVGSLFWQVRLPRRIVVAPSVQAFCEFAGGPRFNGRPIYQNRVSRVLMAGPGMDFLWRNFSLNAAWMYPVVQATADAPGHSGQLVVGLFYNLPQSRFLFDRLSYRSRRELLPGE